MRCMEPGSHRRPSGDAIYRRRLQTPASLTDADALPQWLPCLKRNIAGGDGGGVHLS